MSSTGIPLRPIARNIDGQLDEIKRLIENGFDEESIVSTLWGEKVSSGQTEVLKQILKDIIDLKANPTIALTTLIMGKRDEILNILDQ